MTALQVAESTAERSELNLQPDAVDFLAELHGTFDQRRRDPLAARLEMVAIRAELGEGHSGLRATSRRRAPFWPSC